MLDSKAKITYVFHENPENVLPIFKTAEDGSVHTLDVGETLQAYVRATNSLLRAL